MPNPTLILLPGLHGTAGLFHPFLAHAPSHLPTRILTHPTHRRCSHQFLYQQIETQLANDQNLILLGESFSGPFALRYAAEHPDRVRAVILCASFIGPPVPRILSLLGAPFALIRFPLFNFLLRWFLAGHSATNALLRELRREIHKNRPDVLAHRVASTAWIDGRAALKKCTAPILYLAATRDRLVGPRAARRLRRVRPDVTINRINAPHLLLQEKPVEAWKHIAAFLQRLHEKAPVGETGA